MDNKLKDCVIEGPKLYTSYSGVLVGFSLTLIALLLTLSSEEIKQSPFFEYAIAAFFASSLGFLNSTEWFIKYIRNQLARKPDEDEKDFEWEYDIGSYFYYIGYLSMVLGTVYLLKLFGLRIATVLSYISLLWTFYFFIKDGCGTLKHEDRILRDTIFFPLATVTYLLIIIFTLFNS